MSTDLGKIVWTNGGEYDPDTQYEIYTVVTYNGSSYVSLTDVQGIAPTNIAYWQLVAQKGEQGAQGPQGPQGEKGADGTSFKILGEYETVEDLELDIPDPEIGDAYKIGAEEPFDIYTWTGTIWLNLGPLQGPAGPQGEQGEPGEDGRGISSIARTSGTGAPGTYDTYTITFTDNTTTNFQVYNGADGAKGDKGDKGDTGEKGDKGDTGEPGPNEVSTSTDTNITGLLKGASGKVAQAVAGTDYATPTNVSDAISDHNSDGSAHSEKFNTKESLLKNLDSKANIVDNDSFAMVDSQASDASKKTLWSTIKSTLKAYFDGLYNNYTHPTGDGNLHVPATGTTNNGKVLKAGATAGSISWGTLTAADVGAVTTSDISSAINTHDSDSGAHSAQFGAKLDKSGGTLEDYAEKLVALSGTTPTINLADGSVFTHTLTGNTAYSITGAASGKAHSFTLVITQPETAVTITFPSSVKWQDGEIPDMSTESASYVITFLTVDSGTNWLAMFGGMF